MKDVKLNKKGFTLVELLAVIVILALLIIITANTILPLMNRSKKNAMVVYAERVLSNATSFYQSDTITSSNTTDPQYYVIETIMDTKDYKGCVKVVKGGDGLNYSIVMADLNNDLKIEGNTTSTKIGKKADDAVSSGKDTTTYDADKCKAAATYTTADNEDNKLD